MSWLKRSRRRSNNAPRRFLSCADLIHDVTIRRILDTIGVYPVSLLFSTMDDTFNIWLILVIGSTNMYCIYSFLFLHRASPGGNSCSCCCCIQWTFHLRPHIDRHDSTDPLDSGVVVEVQHVVLQTCTNDPTGTCDPRNWPIHHDPMDSGIACHDCYCADNIRHVHDEGPMHAHLTTMFQSKSNHTCVDSNVHWWSYWYKSIVYERSTYHRQRLCAIPNTVQTTMPTSVL